MSKTWRTLYFALFVATQAQAAQPQRWDFRVFLDDAPIGYHRFTMSENGIARELKSQARFDVKLLFINAYHYTHDATEQWQGNCLESLSARTDDDGKVLEVGVRREDGRMAISAPQGNNAVDGCVMTFAYWNPETLRQTRLVNAQTGEYTPVKIVAVGDETITVRGAAVATRRYRITGAKHPIELWYAADRWVALQSTVDGGRRLRYQLQ